MVLSPGEKAERVLREVWLRIWAQPSTWALADKTSPESQKLQERLRGWVRLQDGWVREGREGREACGAGGRAAVQGMGGAVTLLFLFFRCSTPS